MNKYTHNIMENKELSNAESSVHSIRLINLGDLINVIDLIGNLVKQYSIPEEIAYIMQLVVDEVYVNFCTYGKAIQSDYQDIKFIIKDNLVEIIFHDNGKMFNPVTYSTTKQWTDLLLDGHPAGGLGIHLVKHFADVLDYQYINNFNVLVFKKYW